MSSGEPRWQELVGDVEEEATTFEVKGAAACSKNAWSL